LANPRDENWQERFLLEGKALLSLIHERVQNIEEIFSINRVADGHYYMLKEYIRGEDLQKSNAVKTEHVVGIIREVVKALVEVHKFGICHRDLKPNNIMVEFVENKPRITLIDFGLVKKASSETSSDPGLTTDKFRTGNVIFQSIVTYNHYKQHNFLDDYYSVLHTFYWLVNKKSFYDDHYNLTWQEVAKKVIECKAKYSDPFLDEEIVKGHCRNWGDANCINTFIKFQNIVAEGYKDIYKISKRGLTVKNRTGIHMQLNEVSEKIMGVFQ
jgi:serine/threonine protein kinase